MASDESHIAGIAQRYATAVFELAAEQGVLDSLAADFAAVKQLLAESAELKRLVRSPLFSREEQAKGMSLVMESIAAGSLTRNLALLLARKRRLFALSGIIRAFETLLAKFRGEIEADVTTARPLSPAETAALETALNAKLGRKPRLSTHVDPSLLGGLKVKLGSRMIDTSLRTKLDNLRAAMKAAS